MHLTQIIVGMVMERGRATIDDVMPQLAKDYSRRQVLMAFHNAKESGFLHIAERGRGLGGGRGTAPSTYEAVREPNTRAKRSKSRPKDARPANSAWELGSQPTMPGGCWPPAGAGREYKLLGDWDAA